MHTPVIAIVGRPNVGKSTLFNRMLGEKRAIVEDRPGVTRDRNYAFVERNEIPFVLVDTGGFEVQPTGEFGSAVVAQTLLAVEEADLILAVFDGKDGCHPDDPALMDILRRHKKPVLHVVNKCDGAEHISRTADFYQLGIDEFFDISALHGRRVRDLIRAALPLLPDYEALLEEQKIKIDRQREETRAIEKRIRSERIVFDDDDDDEEVIDEPSEPSDPVFAPVYVPGESDMGETDYDRAFKLRPLAEDPDEKEDEDEDDGEPAVTEAKLEVIRIALIGRPNVGKSTLFNHLIGEERAITSPVAGTTRDALDVRFTYEGQDYIVVDTAGLRKKGRIVDSVEEYSTMRSIGAISNCDVAVLLVDAVEGPTDQDAKVLGLAHDQGKGIIIAVNKWDLVEKDHRTAHDFKLNVAEAFKFAAYAPHLFISALSGRRCENLLRTAREVAQNRLRRVSTAKLNRTLTKQLRRVSPPNYRGGPIKIYYASQIDVAPPLFLLVANYPRGVHFSYLRFVKNIIRDSFGFEGSDVKLKLTSRRAMD